MDPSLVEVAREVTEAQRASRGDRPAVAFNGDDLGIALVNGEKQALSGAVNRGGNEVPFPAK